MDDFEPCTYCGLPATSIDHVPPQSARDRIIASGLERFYPFRELPACKECNGALGARGWTVAERRKIVKEWLTRRYKKYLKIPIWDEEDLAELGPDLQAYVRRGLEIKETTLKRLSF